MRNGTARGIMSLSKDDSTQLWTAVQDRKKELLCSLSSLFFFLAILPPYFLLFPFLSFPFQMGALGSFYSIPFSRKTPSLFFYAFWTHAGTRKIQTRANHKIIIVYCFPSHCSFPVPPISSSSSSSSSSTSFKII